MAFDILPRTNFHELNADWLVRTMKETVETVENMGVTVDGLETRMTAAEGNITALGGRMTIAEGAITDLQSDMMSEEARNWYWTDGVFVSGSQSFHVTTAQHNLFPVPPVGSFVIDSKGNVARVTQVTPPSGSEPDFIVTVWSLAYQIPAFAELWAQISDFNDAIDLLTAPPLTLNVQNNGNGLQSWTTSQPSDFAAWKSNIWARKKVLLIVHETQTPQQYHYVPASVTGPFSGPEGIDFVVTLEEKVTATPAGGSASTDSNIVMVAGRFLVGPSSVSIDVNTNMKITRPVMPIEASLDDVAESYQITSSNQTMAKRIKELELGYPMELFVQDENVQARKWYMPLNAERVAQDSWNLWADWNGSNVTNKGRWFIVASNTGGVFTSSARIQPAVCVLRVDTGTGDWDVDFSLVRNDLLRALNDGSGYKVVDAASTTVYYGKQAEVEGDGTIRLFAGPCYGADYESLFMVILPNDSIDILDVITEWPPSYTFEPSYDSGTDTWSLTANNDAALEVIRSGGAVFCKLNSVTTSLLSVFDDTTVTIYTFGYFKPSVDMFGEYDIALLSFDHSTSTWSVVRMVL